MSILKNNLGHLCQRKAFLLFALSMILMSVLVMAATVNKTVWAIVGVLVLTFYIGASIAMLQVELLAKPFSYCLPGHRTVPVKLLLGGCVIISGILSLPFLLRSGDRLALASVQVLTVFSLGTVFYWLGVWSALGVRNSSKAVGMLGFLPLIIFKGDASPVIESFVFDNWFYVLLLGYGVNYFAYRFLSDNGLARRFCGKKLLAGLDAWSSEKIEEFKQAKLAEKDKGRQYSPLVLEKLFFKLISNPSTGNRFRHILFAIYRAIAFARSQHYLSWRSIILCLFLFFMLGYVAPLSFFVTFIISIGLANINLGIYSTMLVCGGRGERFYSVLGFTVSLTLAVSAMFAIFSVISSFLVPIMPVVRSMTFTGIQIEIAAIPFLMIPLIFASKCYLENNITLTSCLIASVVLLPSFYIIVTLGFGDLTIDLTPMMIAVATLCSWILFVGVLRYVCMRRCLVSNGSR
jgi:hypothetical protein